MKNPGAHRPFQDVGELRWWKNLVLLGLGIDFLLRGCKDDVAAILGEQRAVALQSAGIGAEILVGRELKGIDENARDNEPATFTGDPHEREVAIMKIAHRRHERRLAPGVEGAA